MNLHQMNLIAIMNEWEFYKILRNRGTKKREEKYNYSNNSIF